MELNTAPLLRELIQLIVDRPLQGSVPATAGTGRAAAVPARSIGTGIDAATAQSLLAYSLRLLSSRLAPDSALLRDEFTLAETIKRRLVRQQRTTDAMQFNDLYRRLCTLHAFQRLDSITYLLYSLSPSVGGASMDSANAALASMSLMQTSSDMSTSIAASGSLRLDRSARQISGPGASLSSSLNTSEGNSIPVTLSEKSSGITELYRTQFEEHRSKSGWQIPEAVLVRDILFTFQGVDGQFVRFDPLLDSFVLDTRVGAPRYIRDMVRQLTELSWLYKRVKMYVDVTAGQKSVGLIPQAFCAALQHELSEYYQHVAILETQCPLPIRREDGSFASTGSMKTDSSGSTLTLRRLLAWVLSPLEKFKTLTLMVDSCRGRKGGQFLSCLHAFANHGDPILRECVDRILNLVCAPFFNMIRRWILEGTLEDPFGEFFVSSDADVGKDHLWARKYRLREDMIPTIFSRHSADVVLLIGKSINFIRDCCQDLDWRMEPKFIEQASMLSFSTCETLGQVLDLISEMTNSRLMFLLQERFRFFDHCRAINKYLLLGQGDFIQQLMDLLGDELSKPAHLLLRHNLAGTVDAAVRSSVAQYDDPLLLERLDVKLLQASPGDLGWDVFSLDYHVDSPINAVFTNDAMQCYLRIFNFLWRLKRVENALAATWRRHMTLVHLFAPLFWGKSAMGSAAASLGVGAGGRDRATLSSEDRHFRHSFHMSHILRNQMVHFIYNLSYYMRFEVLECSWQDFCRDIQRAHSLDEVIEAHKQYLRSILENALLERSADSLRKQVSKLFDTILVFQSTQDMLYRNAMDIMEQQSQLEKDLEQRALEGKWGVTDADEDMTGRGGRPSADSKHGKRRVRVDDLGQLQARFLDPAQELKLKTLFDQYDRSFQELLGMLNKDTGHDLLRFLGFRLDFNEYYRTNAEGGPASGSL